MRTEALRVAVAGAGVGGLCLAADLRQQGAACTVLERAVLLRETGAGLQLSPNAVRSLRRLGLGPALALRGVAIGAVETRGWAGDPIARTPLGPECEHVYGAPYYTVLRADLQHMLLGLVGTSSVRLDAEVAGFHDDGTRVRVEPVRGSPLTCDVLVGADGLTSIVREHLIGDAVVDSGMLAIRGLVDLASLPPGAARRLVRVWMGPGAHVVCYPVAAVSMLSVTLVVRSDDVQRRRLLLDEDERPAALHATFSDWHAPVRLIVDALAEVEVRSLQDRHPIERASRGRLAVLGDAAHPMLPFVAQGANQAIEDAAALARHLTGSNDASVADRLSHYCAERTTHAAAVQLASREHGRVLHLPDGAERQQRDAVLRRSSSLGDRAWLYAERGPAQVGA